MGAREKQLRAVNNVEYPLHGSDEINLMKRDEAIQRLQSIKSQGLQVLRLLEEKLEARPLMLRFGTVPHSLEENLSLNMRVRCRHAFKNP
jgi:hypothetical protein